MRSGTLGLPSTRRSKLGKKGWRPAYAFKSDSTEARYWPTLPPVINAEPASTTPAKLLPRNPPHDMTPAPTCPRCYAVLIAKTSLRLGRLSWGCWSCLYWRRIEPGSDEAFWHITEKRRYARARAENKARRGHE